MSLPWVLLVGAAVYGAATGALLPRAAYRLSVEPHEPWRHTCPTGHFIGHGARGALGPARCPECAGGEGSRGAYGSGGGVLALAGALVCAGLAAAVGLRPELAVWLLGTPCALLLAAVDSRVRRLPDLLTFPLAGGTAALLGLAALLPGTAGSWPRALLGGLVLAGAFYVLHRVHPRGMGLGDVKLALALGVALGWYGWGIVFVGAFLAFLLLALYGVALMLAGRAGRRTDLAFGPFMVLGALGGLVLGGIGG